MTDQPRSERLPLDPAHVKWLVEESGISLEVAARAKLYSEHDAKAAAKLLGRMAKTWVGHLPILMIPYYIPFQRDPMRWRGKPLTPIETARDDGKVTFAKYVEAKGSEVHIYFGPSMLEGPALKDVKTPLWITEGERKCLSAESHGLSCLAVSGVHQWHRKHETSLHPDFAHVALDGREVFIAFDRDALQNKMVSDQEKAMGRALMAAGAKVFIVRFPEDAGKLDDFLARHELTELPALMDDARKRGGVEAAAHVQGVPAPATEITELANAERFAKQHGDDLRYCEQTESWYLWTGKRWERDSTGAIIRRAMATVRSIYAEADGLADEDARNAMRKHARKSESHGAIRALVKLAGSLKRLAVTLEAFDADAWLLNVENGTVDLRTGRLAEHNREQLITKLAPVHYEADAKHERWDNFLEGISNGHQEISAFLARAVGYSLTGDTREDRFFFLYGPGGRGKSTFVSAVEAALGDYAKTADVTTFMASPMSAGGDKPRPDLVRLVGSRICVCKEIDQGAKLAEGLVKTIVGGDTITVRDLHSRPFEMRPSFKLWFVANDPPTIRGDDTGMWRRVVRVPFDRPIPNPEKGFREALTQEPELRAAVLAWAVAGVRSWLSEGLAVPDIIQASTDQYRAEMDHTGEFFERRCIVGDIERVSRKELRKAYTDWCEDAGHTPLGARRFTSNLRGHVRKTGLDADDMDTSVRNDAGKVLDGWKFIRLLTDQELLSDQRWGRPHKLIEGGAEGADRREFVGLKGLQGGDSIFSRMRDGSSTDAVPVSSNSIDSPYSPYKEEKDKESKELDRRVQCSDFSEPSEVTTERPKGKPWKL